MRVRWQPGRRHLELINAGFDNYMWCPRNSLVSPELSELCKDMSIIADWFDAHLKPIH